MLGSLGHPSLSLIFISAMKYILCSADVYVSLSVRKKKRKEKKEKKKITMWYGN